MKINPSITTGVVGGLIIIVIGLCFIVGFEVNRAIQNKRVNPKGITVATQVLKTHKSYTGTSYDGNQVTMYFADKTFLTIIMSEAATGVIQ